MQLATRSPPRKEPSARSSLGRSRVSRQFHQPTRSMGRQHYDWTNRCTHCSHGHSNGHPLPGYRTKFHFDWKADSKTVMSLRQARRQSVQMADQAGRQARIFLNRLLAKPGVSAVLPPWIVVTRRRFGGAAVGTAACSRPSQKLSARGGCPRRRASASRFDAATLRSRFQSPAAPWVEGTPQSNSGGT